MKGLHGIDNAVMEVLEAVFILLHIQQCRIPVLLSFYSFLSGVA